MPPWSGRTSLHSRHKITPWNWATIGVAPVRREMPSSRKKGRARGRSSDSNVRFQWTNVGVSISRGVSSCRLKSVSIATPWIKPFEFVAFQSKGRGKLSGRWASIPKATVRFDRDLLIIRSTWLIQRSWLSSSSEKTNLHRCERSRSWGADNRQWADTRNELKLVRRLTQPTVK